MVAPHQSKKTTDHDEIRHWVEERRGKPARVRGTGGVDDPGLLRIDMPDAEPDEELEPITWDTFFEKFEREHLAFVYQDKTKEGQPSRFSKLVQRDG